MRGLLAAALALAALLAPAGAQAQYLDPTPPWPQLLPPRPTTDATQPGPAPGCEQASEACVERVIARLDEIRTRYGCDHRAVFATTYLTVTEVIRDVLRDEPAFYEDRDWLIYQDAIFADYYFRAIDAREAGKPVPEAWRIAFDTAEKGDANGAQDMLLGINAHVQRDMPFVLAEVGLRKPDGSSRKRDHDIGNEMLARSYEPVVKAIAERYDPIVSLSNASWHPVDDVAGLEIVATWREGVWRNAERLVDAKTPEERATVAQQIEDNAAAWARAMADFPQQPGYRETRDAHCAANLPPGAAQSPAAARPARLSAPRRCMSGRLRAAVRGGDGIERVDFSLDGRRLRSDRRGPFELSASTRGLRAGRHRLSARVKYADGSVRTLRRGVRVCAA